MEEQSELFDFGEALKRIEQGRAVARKDWFNAFPEAACYLILNKQQTNDDNENETPTFGTFSFIAWMRLDDSTNTNVWAGDGFDLIVKDWIDVTDLIAKKEVK